MNLPYTMTFTSLLRYWGNDIKGQLLVVKTIIGSEAFGDVFFSAVAESDSQEL